MSAEDERATHSGPNILTHPDSINIHHIMICRRRLETVGGGGHPLSRRASQCVADYGAGLFWAAETSII